MKTKEVLQRFPVDLLEDIDQFVKENTYFNRTSAINHMCKDFLNQQRIATLEKELVELRQTIIKLAMAKEG